MCRAVLNSRLRLSCRTPPGVMRERGEVSCVCVCVCGRDSSCPPYMKRTVVSVVMQLTSRFLPFSSPTLDANPNRARRAHSERLCLSTFVFTLFNFSTGFLSRNNTPFRTWRGGPLVVTGLSTSGRCFFPPPLIAPTSSSSKEEKCVEKERKNKQRIAWIVNVRENNRQTNKARK